MIFEIFFKVSFSFDPFDLSVFVALSCDLRDNIIFAFVCQLVFLRSFGLRLTGS